MPRGPAGGPRITSIGPLSEKTDEEVADEFMTTSGNMRDVEAPIRRTIIDLDNVSNTGKPDVVIEGISAFEQYGFGGFYEGPPEYTSEKIHITFEILYMAAKKGGVYDDYMKAVVAHEYAHHIMSRPDEQLEDAFWKVTEAGLFDYKDMEFTPETYDFPPEQYVDYEGNKGFLEHLKQFEQFSGARPVEGFANSVGTRYADMSFQEYIQTSSSVKTVSSDITEAVMTGEKPSNVPDFPEILTLEWE